MEANSRNPEVEELEKEDPELKVMLRNLEALANSDLREEDSKEVLSDIESLKSLSLDEFKNILERNDPWNDDPTAKFSQLLASFDSLEHFNPHMAKVLIRSLGPVSEDVLSEINSQCEGIYDLSLSERARELVAIKGCWTPYILSQDEVVFSYQKLHSPEWCLPSVTSMSKRSSIFIKRLETVLTNKYKRLYKGQHLLYKRAAITKVLAACNMKYQIALVRDKYLANAAKIKWARNLFARGYQIGVHYGVIIGADTFLKESAWDIHAVLFGSFHDERYKELNQRYQEACQLAKELWEKGDPRWHHQMAKDLIKEERFAMLSYDGLKKRLLPIAEQYGKAFGKNKMQFQRT